MEKVGPSKEYVLVYFNADAQLSAIPDTIFLQQVHAALHPSHKRNLKVRQMQELIQQTCQSITQMSRLATTNLTEAS